MIYSVKKGDSLYQIAKEYNTSAGKLAFDNLLSAPQNLTVGEKIWISEPLVTYKVRSGDTAMSVAARFGISQNELWRNNPGLGGLQKLPVGQILNIMLPKPFSERKIEINGYVYPWVQEETLRRTLPYLTYLTVFTYGFDEEGGLIAPSDEKVISLAYEYGVAPLMQLSTLTSEGLFSSQNAAKLLSDVDLQETLIQNVLSNLEKKRYYGIDVDFEYVEKQYASAYADFIEKLKQKLTPLGYPVFVAVAPKYESNQMGLLYEGLDYKALGNSADGVLLMTYEWGYSKGEPQAVSPVDKVRRVVEYGVSEIDPSKIFLGVPNYGYDWALPYIQGETVATSLSNTQAVQRAWEKRAEISYDEKAASPFYNYYEKEKGNPVKHVVWFEDASTANALANLVEDYGLRGISVWNLMQFFPSLWNVFNAFFTIKRLF